ncbi:hypothetical protein FOBRF1_004133 [Fusarium oxysporum]
MDSFPSVDALINGCKSATGVTSRWDVVVSYSLESLNSVLQRIWTNSITSTTVELITTSLNEDDEEYHTKWWLNLGAPTLQFTRDGKASLCMPLNGKRQVMGKTAAGNERPVRQIPLNTYALYAVIPLGVVSAKSGSGPGAYEFKGYSGNVIRFDEHPDAELHIVINFETTTTEGAAYNVGLTPEIKAQQGPNTPAITDDFSVGLRDKLAAWIADPFNISAIQYALAVVNKTPVPQATFLTPSSLSFSVYSSDKDPAVACLSIYMQTQGSGFEPGNVQRSFNLPNSGDINSFPIPTGYTASIIIRHDVFAQKFLRDSILALKVPKEDKKVFNSVTLMTPTEGFHLTAKLNSVAVADLGNGAWFGGIGGGFRVTDVNWDFGANDLTFKIKGAKASWYYYFKPELKWSEKPMSDPKSKPTYGRTSYEMKLDKSDLDVFEDVSDEGLAALIKVNSSDWQASIQAWSPSLWEIANGASGLVPDSIEKGLKKISLPSFSHTLALHYFATTNVFAPGKHMLSISGASAVYTPYDVIILGNVVETVAMSPPKLDGCGRGLLGATSGNKNITDLINDLAIGRPIMRQLTACVLSNSSPQEVLEKAGYNVSDNDITVALQAADAGPQFDARFVAGLYSFKSPADLASIRMAVDGATGRFYLDGTKLNTSVDNEGFVSWTWGDYSYAVEFTTPYNSKGTADPKTFQGTRTSLSSATVESVSGAELIPDPSDDWFTNTKWGLSTGWVATIFSTGLAVYLWVIQMRADRRNAGRDRMIQAAALTIQLAEMQAARYPLPAETLDNVLNDFQDGIEQAAREKGLVPNIIDDGPAHYDPTAASEAAKERLRSLLKEALTPYLMHRLAPMVTFMGPEAARAAINYRTNIVLDQSQVLDRFNETSPYIVNIMDSVKKREEASEARVKEEHESAAEKVANAELKTNRDNAALESQLLAEQVEKLRKTNKDITEAEMMIKKEYKDIADRIEVLKKAEVEAQKKYQEASDRHADAKRDRERRQTEMEVADNKVKESARDAFRRTR